MGAMFDEDWNAEFNIVKLRQAYIKGRQAVTACLSVYEGGNFFTFTDFH